MKLASNRQRVQRRINAYFRLLRRKFNRGKWLTFALGMPMSEDASDRPGLIIIQIDGLSRQRMEQGMERGRLPFLRHLIQQKDYTLHTHYSGLPSSTPAVQAEIFYGLKTTVPAFAFFNRETGRAERMFEPDVAARVERELEERSDGGLLTGGSSYSNNFTGGAAPQEAHFCASSLGFKTLLSAFSPVGLLITAVSNIMSILRLIALLIVELLLSVWDFVRGVYQGRNFLKELKFVPTRIAISVTLREICVMGAKMDIHRGLPVIHMNFLGYDEQSHRRGPDSKFAQWTLKGIDYAIARVWRDAARAERREYEVWIYSDHGQCSTTPYHSVTGYVIEDAVMASLGCMDIAANAASHTRAHTPSAPTRYDTTANLISADMGCLCCSRRAKSQERSLLSEIMEGVHVVGLGPVAFVYFTQALPESQLRSVAKMLASNHRVPCTLIPNSDGTLTAFTESGCYSLPREMEAICGSDHPFLECFREDLIRLCKHRNAGDITLLGWSKGTPQITFAVENGSHAGLAAEETAAFALLPRQRKPIAENAQFIRPADLRKAALAYLGRKSAPAEPVLEPGPESLRVLTYNVHSCIGTDGKLSTKRIARVIAQQRPHIVALQEVDVGRSRTGGYDQARQIAQWLKMAYYFHPSIHIEEEQYGNVILTHLPMRLIKAGALPGWTELNSREPRGVLWAVVEFEGREIQVINTHLGLSPSERLQQVDYLLGKEWLGHDNIGSPLILCGDFNALPNSRPMRRLRSRLRDVQIQLKDRPPLATFHSFFPAIRIDHILIDRGLQVGAIQVPRSILARTASDHLPLIADLRLDTALRSTRHPAL